MPFIARYRKEATGTLDDAQLRTLEERLGYLRELEDRRTAVLEEIRKQGKLDAALEDADPRRRVEGAAGGHLPAVQAQAADEGDDRARGRAGAAGRRAAGRPGPRPRRDRRRLPRARPCPTPPRRWRAPGRSSSSGSPRTPTSSAGCASGCGPAAGWSTTVAGGQGDRRSQVLGLLRLLRAVHQAPVPPHPRGVPRGEGGGARRRAGPRRGRGLRADDRGRGRRRRPGPPGRPLAGRGRPLGLAHPDPGAPGHRHPRPVADGGRGGRDRRLRHQPARSAAGRARRQPRHDGAGPGAAYRREGRGRRRHRQGRRHRHDLPARAPAGLGRLARDADEAGRRARRRAGRDRQRHRVAGDRPARP